MTRSPITGRSFERPDFTIRQTRRTIPPDSLSALLRGEALGLLVKEFQNPAICGTLWANFRFETKPQKRGDNVPAINLGAAHYAKTPEQYFAEVEATYAEVDRLSTDVRPIGDIIRDHLSAALPPEMIIRRAEFNGQAAGDVRAAMWTGCGDYILKVHEDYSQMTAAGFEIDQIKHPIAVNFYPYLSPNCGPLRAYNIAPDLETRRRLGLENSGYPYPIEELDGIDHLDVDLESGDLLLFNGSFLHGVLAAKDGQQADRLLINLFLGLLPNGKTVITFT